MDELFFQSWFQETGERLVVSNDGKAYLLEVFVRTQERTEIEVEVIQNPRSETDHLGPSETILRLCIVCEPLADSDLAVGGSRLPRFLASPNVRDYYFRLNRKTVTRLENR